MPKQQTKAVNPLVDGKPVVTFTCQKLSLNVPEPYAEGHTLTAPEATALNQAYKESIRNNARTGVDACNGDAVAAQKVVDGVVSTYTFGTRTGGGRSTNPVAKEAKGIARVSLDRALKAKGIKKDDYPDYKAKIVELAKRPDILQRAKEIVESSQVVIDI